MSIEAMKLALDFFEKTSNCLPIRYDKEGLAVHIALRQAIEQAQKQIPPSAYSNTHQPEQAQKQEPFCYVNVNSQGDVTRTVKRKDAWCKTPLYTKEHLHE